MKDKFRNAKEKQRFLGKSVEESIAIHVEMPCTTLDCLNTAKVALAYYNPVHNEWLLTPICRSCTVTLNAIYNVADRDEAERDAAGFTPDQAIIAQSIDPACWNAEECEIMNPSPRRNTDDGPAIIV